ncbi:HD-GYP domain-containing protein [Anatilimnocola floriformis]|uniref:HD-GYP domain-containing protein n=1 Tax=Anatilimnocola floriformis TaxID=2948575 RepID=UPI0020C280BC|nr:HD-GYP domain-containing protein [Anatilimnocola floriformis]
MSSILETPAKTPAVTGQAGLAAMGPAQAELSAQLQTVAVAARKAFGATFSLWDGDTGELLHVSLQQPGSNDPQRGALVRGVVGLEPQFLADEDVVLLLGIPFQLPCGTNVVATAAFAIASLSPDEPLGSLCDLLTVDERRARQWLSRQSLWTPESLLRLASAVQAQLTAEWQSSRLSREVEKLSNSLASTYEEICLLHGVTQNLRISRDEEELATLITNWILDCLPTRGAAIQLLPVAKEGNITYKARTQSTFITAGNCPLDDKRFRQLVEYLRLEAGCAPLVLNTNITGRADWPFPEIRELIIAPMSDGTRLFGWLTVCNHNAGEEFGTVEASLLNSVGAMLGIHSGNRDLYREQAEFLASVVRALTSAIDAKDPYTCGHSDRVARISVRLAKEMGCSTETLHTLYMSGLLHDIGKIGIDDAVLRKPGKLTDAEFEHIKEHPELGYRILADIKQLADVLPAVLHHHEQWDGGGYPFKLNGDQTPQIARIVAVADAFDAMSSDRPYRKGLPFERVDQIFKEGAGKQWDPQVIGAYFSARDDIMTIAQNERANLSLDVLQWS